MPAYLVYKVEKDEKNDYLAGRSLQYISWAEIYQRMPGINAIGVSMNMPTVIV